MKTRLRLFILFLALAIGGLPLRAQATGTTSVMPPNEDEIAQACATTMGLDMNNPVYAQTQQRCWTWSASHLQCAILSTQCANIADYCGNVNSKCAYIHSRCSSVSVAECVGYHTNYRNVAPAPTQEEKTAFQKALKNCPHMDCGQAACLQAFGTCKANLKAAQQAQEAQRAKDVLNRAISSGLFPGQSISTAP